MGPTATPPVAAVPSSPTPPSYTAGLRSDPRLAVGSRSQCWFAPSDAAASDAAVAAPQIPLFRYPQKRFAGIPGDNRSLQLTCCLLLPGLGWFAPPKFTRV